ncbi:MAG: GPW/gp25 family protein [Fluviibacter sp.]
MKAIKFPFSLDTYGRITPTTDDNKIYMDRVVTLLSTNIYQRPMNLTYGSDIGRALFESGGAYKRAIKEAITRAIYTYLPGIQIRSIYLVEVDQNGESRIDLTLALPSGDVETTTIKKAFFLGDGTTGEIE